jgi:hypothetical protein
VSETPPNPAITWGDYVLRRGDGASDLLRAAASTGRLTIVMGDGFDPRALQTLRAAIGTGAAVRVVRIPLPPGPGYGAQTTLVARNRADLEALVENHGLEVVQLQDPQGSDRLTIGSLLARTVLQDGVVTPADAVVIDISALPSRVFFPLIGSLLELGRRHGTGELLVAVSENPALDRRIVSDGISDAGPITGFVNGLNVDVDDKRITMWAPVIGEASSAELEAIYDLLQQPQEIHPILPFPAVNPRRGDDLALEHRELLFDRFDVDPRNILYVDESNAFDTYRAITNLYRRSRELLVHVGDLQLVVSAHASKMLSAGVCLAAWESRLPVVTASPTSFGLPDAPDDNWVENSSTMCCMWLHGTPYR